MFKISYSYFYVTTETVSHRTGRELKKPRRIRNYVDISMIDKKSQSLPSAIANAQDRAKARGWTLQGVNELKPIEERAFP